MARLFATAGVPWICLHLTVSLAAAQSAGAGHVNFVPNAQSNFDPYTSAPDLSLQQWMQSHYAAMVVYPPYFNTRTSWFPNAYAYLDLYGIHLGSWEQTAHPEWILHDQWGHWLYMPWGCSSGTCPMYAADITNPGFRWYWINTALSTISAGNYPALFIDDVNLEFRVSDGWGNPVAPVDSNTGQPMTYDAWRSYVATFLEEIRAAMPGIKIMQNSIWYAGPAGARDIDPSVQRQIATANTINIERGIANDGGLTGGTGVWSLNAIFSFIDRLHEAGRTVNFQEYWLDGSGLEYGLAGYFMVSNGSDSIGDAGSTPGNWWQGYNTDLGTALGPRVYNNGVFERDFTGGKALLGEPGLAPRYIDLGGTYLTLSGNWVTGVTIGGWQGIVLIGPVPIWPIAVTRYLSDVTPIYAVNGWGNVQNDVTVLGTPLALNGVHYAKGLGVHAYSEVRYALWGNCPFMTAKVGIDDEVPAGSGSVDFQVWADGSLLYDSGFMTSGNPRQSVNVNLTGRQTLGLVVTNGIYMAPSWTTYDDHADWANATIVCSL